MKDSHFTVLGFTAATGAPVWCAIVFAAKQLYPQWVTGMDPFCDFTGEEEDDMEMNTGNGKMFPLGPECTFNNKQVPTFCCCSENGSIASELLTKMLAHIDNCGIFNRSDGVAPLLAA